MKTKTILICCIAALSLPYLSLAQIRQQDKSNPDIKKAVCSESRTEIILPDVDGLKAVKTDLHSHTIYSDGDCSPEYRVREAWRDGLDAIALTDHIEYRPGDTRMANYLGTTCPQTTDLNHSVRLAQRAAANYGITLIPGIEITRSPKEIGHFNALFTTDNNAIPDPDPLVAIKNAKAQNALVQNNHPGWDRTDANLTETTKKAIAAGLLDGMECINDKEFYQKSIEDALGNGLYVCAGTDIHSTTYDVYLRYGVYRDMTIVFAEDASLESIKEGLLAKRTLAYGYGDICGEKTLLEKFFIASFDFKIVRVEQNGKKHILVTNKTSFPYTLGMESAAIDLGIGAFCSNIVTVDAGKDLVFTVNNMWYGTDKHPTVTVSL